MITRKIAKNCGDKNFTTIERSLIVISYYLLFVVRYLVLFAVRYLVFHAQIKRIANI